MLFWKWNKPKEKRIENIGPDIPQVNIKAEIVSYSAISDNRDHVNLTLRVAGCLLTCPAPIHLMKSFPIGTDIHLVMVKSKQT